MPLKPLLFGLLVLVLAVSVVTDARQRRIYDWVTFPAMAVALGLRFFGQGLGELEAGVISGLVGLVACAVVFGSFALFGKGLGWGDVKLAMVVGAGLGYPLTLAALMFIALAGAAQAIVFVIWKGSVSDTLARLGRRGTPPEEGAPGRHIPYGVAIALGSVWAMWWDRASLGGS